MLECSTFDIISRKFGDEWLDVYCDDEGLTKGKILSMITIGKDEQVIEKIVGTIFIVNHNNNGETISLTDEQIKKVMDCRTTVEANDGEIRKIIISYI